MLREHDRRNLLPFSDLSKKEIVAFFFASTLRDIFFLRAYLLVRFITAFVHQNLPQILGTVLSKKKQQFFQKLSQNCVLAQGKPACHLRLDVWIRIRNGARQKIHRIIIEGRCF